MKANYKNFIGVDVSKLTLDICLLSENKAAVFHQIKNDAASISSFFQELFSRENLSVATTLICAEHTGHYSNILERVLLELSYHFWLADPYTIKHSQGIQRGKNDKIDASRIAQYAQRNHADVRLSEPLSPVFEKIEYLRSQRDLLVIDVAKYKAQIKGEAKFFDSKLYQAKCKRFEVFIKEMSQAIKEIEGEIHALICAEEELKNQYDIMLSIDGIGKVVATEVLLKTEGFRKFRSARSFACHAGCAPFEYVSGTSIRSRNKVSFRADKNLKKLFHMAALSTITMGGEMKVYFARKVAEGKSKMSILNAIRSKLIHRIFALIKRNEKYDKNYTQSFV